MVLAPSEHNQLDVVACGVEFKNPIVLAAGVLGSTLQSMRACVEAGVGGITTASVMLDPETGELSERSETIIAAAKTISMEYPAVPVIISIVANHTDEYAKLSAIANESGAAIIEVYINVPAVYQADQVGLITSAVVQHCSVPVSIKLSPLGWNVTVLAKAAQQAGAKLVTAITGLPGAGIGQDNHLHTSFNSYINGPELKPVALKTVSEIYLEYPTLPIIGTGGVSSAEDVLEMIKSGSTLVGVGTKAFQEGPSTFTKLLAGVQKTLTREAVSSMGELQGLAL